nr:unnamed protein product [Digitaria exilis]
MAVDSATPRASAQSLAPERDHPGRWLRCGGRILAVDDRGLPGTPGAPRAGRPVQSLPRGSAATFGRAHECREAVAADVAHRRCCRTGGALPSGELLPSARLV